MKYILSWTRDDRRFRWEAEDGDVRFCKAAMGLLWVIDTKDDIGRLVVEAEDLRVNGDGLATFKALGATMKKARDLVPAAAKEIGHGGFHRLCWNDDDYVESDFACKWRACDELGDNEMRYVDSYRGLWYVDWHDTRAHLYHKGRMFVDPANNFGYLVPEDIPAEFVKRAPTKKKVAA